VHLVAGGRIESDRADIGHDVERCYTRSRSGHLLCAMSLGFEVASHVDAAAQKERGQHECCTEAHFDHVVPRHIEISFEFRQQSHSRRTRAIIAGQGAVFKERTILFLTAPVDSAMV